MAEPGAAAGASSFFEHAASVNAAAQEATIKLFPQDLFATTTMASPFFLCDDPGVSHPLCGTFYAFFWASAARSARRRVMAASRAAMPGSSLGSGITLSAMSRRSCIGPPNSAYGMM